MVKAGGGFVPKNTSNACVLPSFSQMDDGDEQEGVSFTGTPLPYACSLCASLNSHAGPRDARRSVHMGHDSLTTLRRALGPAPCCSDLPWIGCKEWAGPLKNAAVGLPQL